MAKDLGKWSFLIGAILALIMGIGAGLNQVWANNAWLTVILVLAGLIVGFVNITAKEAQGFLIAAIAVLAANTANLATLFPGLLRLGAILAGIVAKLLVVIAPAALLVGLRAVYKFAAE